MCTIKMEKKKPILHAQEDLRRKVRKARHDWAKLIPGVTPLKSVEEKTQRSSENCRNVKGCIVKRIGINYSP